MNTLKLIDELTRDEGLRLDVYSDCPEDKALLTQLRGKLTIGVGRNLTDVRISREEAYHFLNNDLERTFADLDQYLPWWRSLAEVRQRVIANMGFNLGVDPQSRPPGKLTIFKQTLALMQSNDYAGAAEHMLTLPWARQVSVRAQRLAQMWRTGLEP